MYLIVSILGIILILFLTYFGTKWMTKRASNLYSSKYIKILDRVMLGNNKYLALVEVSEKYYLIGVADSNINLIKEIEDIKFETGVNDTNGKEIDFSKILNNILKKGNRNE